MLTLKLRDLIAGGRLKRETHRRVRELQHGPAVAARKRTRDLLGALRASSDAKVLLGETSWGERVEVPLIDMVKACGLTTGGMGSGKTMFALLPIAAMLRNMPQNRSMSFGVLDPKGELFERSLYLVYRRAEELKGAEREEFLSRVVVIDFSSREAVTPYNILARWPHADKDKDFFLTSRSETLRDLLPAGEKLSLPGANVLKHVLALLSETNLPLTYLEPVLSNDELRHKMLSQTKNSELRHYFNRHFAKAGPQVIGAVRVRMETLFASDSVRLALSGSSAPDFRRLQNEGCIVLINCAGPTIARGVRLLLQGLVLSDIRQSIFARPKEPPVTYLWFCDEAQNFFLTKQQQTEMTDLLTMARSFGSFFYFLCQNLTASVSDAQLLDQLHTNIRWSLTLRGSPRDAGFLRPALPVTGRLLKPDAHPYRERSHYSAEEERSHLLNGIAHLPDKTGYLWLKTRSPEAIKISTSSVGLPKPDVLSDIVEQLRNDPALGARLSREEYLAQIAERDREWLGGESSIGLEERFEQTYQAQEAVWQTS